MSPKNPCFTKILYLNSLSQLVKFQKIVEHDIKTELEKDFDNRQRMLPTYVIKLPDGTEVGDYIVLDFGGKFFRTGIQEPNEHHHQGEANIYGVYPIIKQKVCERISSRASISMKTLKLNTRFLLENQVKCSQTLI